MPDNKITILSTRPVSTLLQQNAVAGGIELDMLSFIETSPVATEAVQQRIEQKRLQTANVVFTSMNAVEAVAAHEHKQSPPAWKIYCIGHGTRRLVEKHFGSAAIAGTANDAGELADQIIAAGTIHNVVFFCGNQRREELPSRLKAHGIIVEEIIVYQTTAIQQRLEKVYDGILFFSPSAVESFFEVNTIPSATILFAIGTTTASAIKKYSNNPVIVSNQPGKELLVKQALHYFQHKLPQS